MTLHVGYCKEFGISKEQIMATEENEGKGHSTLQSQCKANINQLAQLIRGISLHGIEGLPGTNMK